MQNLAAVSTYKTILVAMLTLLTIPLTGQQSERQFTEHFRLPVHGEVNVENRYGDVWIQGWDHDSVKVDIEIWVSGKSQEEADDLAERIVPDVKTLGDFLYIKSEIRPGRKKGFFKQLFEGVEDLFDPNRSEIDINYSIWMPAAGRVEIVNKYGDVFVDDFSGSLEADVEHGNLRLGSLVSNLDLAVKFGKITARELPNCTINLSSGELDITTARHLQLTSSGSRIQLGSVEGLKLESGRDEIEINQAGSIDGEVRYSDILIRDSRGRIDLDLHISDFRVELLGNTTPDIRLEQYACDIEIEVAGAMFRLEASLEEGTFRIPDSVRDLETIILDEKDNKREIRAKYGRNPQGLIYIEGRRGFIYLKE